MFENLSERLERSFKILKGEGKITEINVAETVKDIRKALLDADVSYKVAKDFCNRVKDKAIGANVLTAVKPQQMMVKIMHDELAEFMGSSAQDINIKGNPGIVLVAGLNGSGKTTFTGKLALHIKSKRGMKVLVAACDTFRPAAIEQLKVLGESVEVPVYTGAPELLEKLTGYRLSRGILCAMRRPAPADAAEICENARRIAVLEGVVDATNIGAIFRSAAALGMDAVLLSPTCCDPLNRRAVRVSMGTVFQIPWAVLERWPQDMNLLRALGFQTAAMALCDDSVSLDDPRLEACGRLAVVLGAEGDGLARSTVAACDYTVRIPMAHGVDSLNVAAASAVAFWQLRRK